MTARFPGDPPPAQRFHRAGPIFVGRKVAGNFAILVAGEVSGRLLSLAAVAWLTRSLGVEGFGVFSFGLALATYGTLVGLFGLDLWGTRQAARGEDPARLVGRLVALRAPLAVGAFLLIAVIAVLQPNSPARWVGVILAFTALVDVMNLSWAFLGLEQMRPVALAVNLKMALFAVGALLLVREPTHVGVAALLTVGTELAAACLLWWVFVRCYGWPRLRFSLPFARLALPQAFPFVGVHLTSALRYNFDVLLIGLVLGGAQAGLYSAPYRIFMFLASVAGAYFTALLPALARTYVAAPGQGERLVQLSVRIMTVVLLPLVVGGVTLAPELVMLLFGADFAPSATVLQVLLCAFIPLSLAGSYRILLRAYDRQTTEMRALAWSAAVNVGLNVVLVPTTGLLGAATATLAAETVLLVVSWYGARRLVSRTMPPGVVVRPLMAALMMGLVLVLLPPRPLLMSLVIGPLVYFPLLLLIRGLTWREVRDLRAQLASPADGAARG